MEMNEIYWTSESAGLSQGGEWKLHFLHYYEDEQDIVSSNPLCLQHLKIAEFLFPSVNNFMEYLHRI